MKSGIIVMTLMLIDVIAIISSVYVGTQPVPPFEVPPIDTPPADTPPADTPPIDVPPFCDS